MRDSLLLGQPGHLTKADSNLIQQHFNAIISILQRAGMDRVHVFEYAMNLVQHWWVDTLL